MNKPEAISDAARDKVSANRADEGFHEERRCESQGPPTQPSPLAGPLSKAPSTKAPSNKAKATSEPKEKPPEEEQPKEKQPEEEQNQIGSSSILNGSMIIIE